MERRTRSKNKRDILKRKFWNKLRKRPNFFQMKLVNPALYALYDYYFARMVKVLAQFSIKCLNFSTGIENVNW